MLLGYGANDLVKLTAGSARMDGLGDFLTIDFSQTPEQKLNEDPTHILNELKQRYGGMVGGKLNFKGIFTTYMQHVYYCEADLTEAEITLRLSNGGWKGM